MSNDDETFVVAGIPSLDFLVMEGDSYTRHHAIIDTLDKIDPCALALDTAVLAVASYSIANTDQRRLTVREVQQLLKKIGEAEDVELDYGRQEQKEP